ncbi:RDD family protein [Verrucomicrobiales bacterium BCK34]|nr:RDD family protein [Verrucomicrobiales bacterium BCK34]
MDFYLSIGGEKKGPYSIFKVSELIESKEATDDTLVWHVGMTGWKPLKDVPALENVFEHVKPKETKAPERETYEMPPVPEETPDGSGAATATMEASPVHIATNVRPFLRFWARMFDYTLVSVIVFLLSDVVMPQPLEGESVNDLLTRYIAEMQKPEALLLARTQFFAMIGWHFLEGILLHVLGTTPGKALFGIRVRQIDGTRLQPLKSVGRSFYIYLLGVGFYQVPFILIGMVFSFFRLMSTGDCLWDQHLGNKVEYTKLGGVRIMLAIGAFFVLIMLQSLKFS